MESKRNLYIYFVFCILCIFYAYEFFLRISPSILVDSLLQQYHVGALGISSFSSAYFFGYLLMQLPAGFLLDSYGFKKVMSTALLTCVVGTLIFTLSHHLGWGLLGRFILGCGSAFSFIGAICFIRTFFPENAFSFLVSWVISVGTIAGAVGQVFAVNIINYLSWHLTIDGMASWGLILTLAIIMTPNAYLAKPSGEETESKIKIPTLHTLRNFMALIQIRELWLNALIGGLLYLPTSVIAATWGVEFFKDTFHQNTNSGSIAITTLFIGWAIGGPIFSLLSSKASQYGIEKYLMVVSALIGAALLLFLFSEKTLSAFMLSGLLFIFGLLSSSQLLIWRFFSQIIEKYEIAKQRMALAIALTNLIIMLFIAFADLVLGGMISFLNHHEIHQNLHLVFYVLPGAMICGGCLILCLPLEASAALPAKMEIHS
jgi:MFS family permease